MHKLLEGGTKIVFPAYGIAVASGHKRHLFELNPGTRNHETAEQLLKDGWDRLEHVWKVVWAEKIIGALRDALKREAVAFPQTRSQCAAEPAAASNSPRPRCLVRPRRDPS